MKDKLHTNLGNIIYIYDVLKKYSDVDHILSIKDIIKYVKEEFDEEIEDRTVRRNIRVLIEKFGTDIEIQKIDENYFKATLNVCPKGLKMWIMQYLNYVEVLEPLSIREELKNNLKEILKKY